MQAAGHVTLPGVLIMALLQKEMYLFDLLVTIFSGEGDSVVGKVGDNVFIIVLTSQYYKFILLRITSFF